MVSISRDALLGVPHKRRAPVSDELWDQLLDAWDERQIQRSQQAAELLDSASGTGARRSKLYARNEEIWRKRQRRELGEALDALLLDVLKTHAIVAAVADPEAQIAAAAALLQASGYTVTPPGDDADGLAGEALARAMRAGTDSR